jgi:nucleotidyltransferase substrate binding protein (TIGR01987 family)
MDSRTLLDDFAKALDQFQNALQLPAENDVIKAGCIQYFEFTFELAWKSIKRFAEDEGIADCNSPKSALKAAFGKGWINEEEIWLDMLSRNKMSHTYHAAEAMSIYNKLPVYSDRLKKLAEQLARLD